MSDSEGSGARIRVAGAAIERGAEILTPEALAFVGELQDRFGSRRDELLRRRRARRTAIAQGGRLDFLPDTVLNSCCPIAALSP